MWFRLPEGFPMTADEFMSRCMKEAEIGVFAGNLSR